jgi:hypothetical protein
MLIDILIEAEIKLPAWLHHKEFIIGKDEKGVVDLIK